MATRWPLTLPKHIPNICGALSAAPALGKETPVAHVWHRALCPRWYSWGYFLGGVRKRRRDTSAWQVSAAVWHDGLFSLLAACVLTLLQQEAHRRRVSHSGFAEDELVVVVGAAIRRGVAAQFGLAGVRSDHAQVCLPGDPTGPSASYAIVVRHPRFRAPSQVEWRDVGPTAPWQASHR